MGHGGYGSGPVFQHGFSNGTPWSPPPPSTTPSRAMSPMSMQSLSGGWPPASSGGGGDGGNGNYYYGSTPASPEPGMFGHQPSISSITCVSFFWLSWG